MKNIDILISPGPTSSGIIDTLVSSGCWHPTDCTADLEDLNEHDLAAVVRLVSTGMDQFRLTLWPESVYCLDINAPLVEAPDFYPQCPALLEESMDCMIPDGGFSKPHVLSDPMPGFLLTPAIVARFGTTATLHNSGFATTHEYQLPFCSAREQTTTTTTNGQQQLHSAPPENRSSFIYPRWRPYFRLSGRGSTASSRDVLEDRALSISWSG